MTGVLLLFGLSAVLCVSLCLLPPGRSAALGLGVAVVMLAILRFAMDLPWVLVLSLVMAVGVAAVLQALRPKLSGMAYGAGCAVGVGVLIGLIRLMLGQMMGA